MRMNGGRLRPAARNWRRAAVLFGKTLGLAVIVAGALAQSASAAAERSLAGIKIFSRSSTVLHKYGTPSEVIPGGAQVLGSGAVGMGMAGGGAAVGGLGRAGGIGGPPMGYPGAPGGMGGPGALPGFGGGTPGGMPPEFGGGMAAMRPGGKLGAMGMAGAGPGRPPTGYGGMGRAGGIGGPPMGYPGAPGGSPFGNFPGAGRAGTGAGAQTPVEQQEVTWIYDRPDGSSLEFTLSPDGRVVQIRATGYKSPVRTGKGVSLGQSYATVLSKYGYPESQDADGQIINANYSEKYHAAFQFYNQKLVGIIVAAVQ